MRNKPQSNAKFVAGAILGAILGGGLAMLLTPKTGREHQEVLKERAKRALRKTDARLDEIEAELEGYIANLKSAARDLRGEAYEDSQRLITRAEMLKNDLQDSAARLARTGKVAKDDATIDAKRLVSEGQEVMGELERMTKKIIRSARGRVRNENEDRDDSDHSE